MSEVSPDQMILHVTDQRSTTFEDLRPIGWGFVEGVGRTTHLAVKVHF